MTSPMHSPLQSPLQPVMRSPLEFRRRGGGSFDIASTNPSAYYDRTNLATLFQDSAGTIAIPGSGYSIGYGGDLSGGGNNQIQATAGKRPILRQSPAGGVRNLLTYTEDFRNAAWTKVNCSLTAGATLAPDGTTTATLISATASSNIYVTRLASPPNSSTFSCYMKAGTTDIATVAPQAQTGGDDATFDLTAITVINKGTNNSSATIVDVGNGWRRCEVVRGSAFDDSGPFIGKFGATTGDTLYIWGAQLELGSTATPYQKVTNQYTVTEEGVPSVWRAKFDAVDDDLGTTFPASLGAGCTVCRSLPGTGASITTGVTLTATFTDNVDAHALLIYTAAQWAALDAGQIANITTWLNGRAGL